MPIDQPIGVRWTIGHVHPLGFDALRLSVWGAWKLFGPAAKYVVCVNSVPLAQAQEMAGPLPPPVRWREASGELPGWMQPHLTQEMTEGTSWKLAPVRLFPGAFEVSLDNDCILWRLPPALHRWIADPSRQSTAIAADTRRMLGSFSGHCAPGSYNAGIRGLPPRLDLEQRLWELLAGRTEPLDSELEEQGLQVAAVTGARQCHVVELDDVAICSPFPDHCQQLGRCGAHFVGLNAWELPWQWQGRPASSWTREFWLRHREKIARRVGVAATAASVGAK